VLAGIAIGYGAIEGIAAFSNLKIGFLALD
jgi:hypothetical protein